MDECIQFLKENALIDSRLSNRVVYATGIKVYRDTKRTIEGQFGVRLVAP